ncbi:MAG: flippase activity-associated protein Agl23 [Halobacteriales archaeon]
MGVSDAIDGLSAPGDVRARVEANPAVAIVLALTAVALLVRLVALGARVAHWDEARVAYWVLHFADTGQFHYRYIIHGPFVQHIGAVLFGPLGANDFAMRLPVALVGGLLPAAALLYREHLRRAELVGAAFFLSLNPILVYYSRFFRSTIPAAAFAFVAFGLLVRAYDTRRARYVHVAVVFVALAFAAKENAVVYLLTWLGATALLVDHALFRPRERETGIPVLAAFWQRYVRGVFLSRTGLRLLGHLALAAVLFVAVALFFYAPRAGSAGGADLWAALANPGELPALVETTLYGSDTPPRQPGVITGYEYWLGGGTEVGDAYDSLFDRYITFLGSAMRAVADFAAPLVGLALVGFFAERYATRDSRNLVMFASYWGFVSLLGFPLGSDIANPWITINGLVPLVIPAGVGIALFYRWARESWERDDTVSAAITGLVFLLVALQIGQGLAVGVYTNDQSDENSLVQYAQPAGDLRPDLRRMRTAAAETEGVDVLVYGEELVDGDAEATREPACVKWFDALPLPWYFAAHDATVDCAMNESDLDEALGDSPPIVVSRQDAASDVSERLPEYRSRTYELRSFGTEVTVFVHPDYDSSDR